MWTFPPYVRAGQRVLGSECSLCQTFTVVCSARSLSLSFGLDMGFQEKLAVRQNATTKTELPPKVEEMVRAEGIDSTY